MFSATPFETSGASPEALQLRADAAGGRRAPLAGGRRGGRGGLGAQFLGFCPGRLEDVGGTCGFFCFCFCFSRCGFLHQVCLLLCCRRQNRCCSTACLASKVFEVLLKKPTQFLKGNHQEHLPVWGSPEVRFAGQPSKSDFLHQN